MAEPLSRCRALHSRGCWQSDDSAHGEGRTALHTDTERHRQPAPPPCSNTCCATGCTSHIPATPGPSLESMPRHAARCVVQIPPVLGLALKAQSDRTGGTVCPEGQPCCWLKSHAHDLRGIPATPQLHKRSHPEPQPATRFCTWSCCQIWEW